MDCHATKSKCVARNDSTKQERLINNTSRSRTQIESITNHIIRLIDILPARRYTYFNVT